MSQIAYSRTIIVAGVDPSADSAIWVLDRAFDEAVRRQPADVHLLRAVRRHKGVANLIEAREELEDVARDRLEIFTELAGDVDWSVHAHARVGEPAEEIAILAAEVGADLICVGAAAHRKRTVPSRLLELAECPVLVERPKEYATPREELGSFVCPDCERVREATDGKETLCPRHRDAELPLSAVLAPHGRMPYMPGGLH